MAQAGRPMESCPADVLAALPRSVRLCILLNGFIKTGWVSEKWGLNVVKIRHHDRGIRERI